jgi:glycosyltransferase involved in cell wall biosynthesis
MNQTKSNILFITHAYYNKGGVEEHVRDLCLGLKDTFNCYILTPVNEHPQFPHYQLIFNGIPVEIFSANPFNQALSPLKDEFANTALNRTLKKIKPDLIHVHHLQNWPLEILKQIIDSSIPTIFTAHDYFLATPIFTMEFSDHPKDLLSKDYSMRLFGKDITDYLKLRRSIYLESINKLKHLIVPSKNTQNEMSKIIATDYKIISHGIKEFSVRKTISDSKNLNFGYIGSLIRQKGWETLIKGFKIAKEKNRNIHLKVYGNGFDKESVIANKEIDYCGPYTRKDLPEILSNFQIGIIPSIFKETFCYSLAEIQQAELPVIASNIGAIPERVNLNSGFLFEPGNHEQLAEKILNMATEYQSRKWEINKPKQIYEMCIDYKNLYQSITN